MIEKHIVTCFLEHQFKILLLKRSDRVGTYVGRWAGISGYIENGYTSLQQAYIEINEETGVTQNNLELKKIGNPFPVIDESLNTRWIVHPFRFALDKTERITIDWEHIDLQWINPEEINSFETVPGLSQAWEAAV